MSKGRLPAGRPKGSTVNRDTGLTKSQESIAHKMLSAELKTGVFPASVADVVKMTGRNPSTIRALLRKKEFQDYLAELLKAEGVVLEGAFWRGLALGMQVGDIKTLELYARMTGKIAPVKQEKKIEITVKSPDGLEALPTYAVDEDGDIIDAEVVE